MIKNTEKRIIALGYFDCVHIAHRQILQKTRDIALVSGIKSAAITFSDNVKSSHVYNLHERVRLLSGLVDDVITFDFTQNIKNMSPVDFLDMLSEKYGAVGFVCGYDHKFGKNAAGDCDLLVSYCKKKGYPVAVVDKMIDGGEVVSASRIKHLLQTGDIQSVNKLLYVPYHITAEVVRGKGQGHIFGFPTVNFMPETNQILPKSGVYSTMSDIVLGKFKSVTNVGIKPTFNDTTISVETFIGDGFNGDLYDRNITVYFNKYLRDIKKFASPDELKKQIFEDIRR